MENDDFNAVLSPQHTNYYTTSQLGRADVPSLGALTPKAFYKNMHYFMIPFKMQVMEHFYQPKTSNRPTVVFSISFIAFEASHFRLSGTVFSVASFITFSRSQHRLPWKSLAFGHVDA